MLILVVKLKLKFLFLMILDIFNWTNNWDYVNMEGQLHPKSSTDN